MVRSKGGGGDGDKYGSGEKQERGEEKTSSEGGGTYWWVGRPEKRLVGSALAAVRDGGRWRRLVVVIRFR